MAHRPRLLGLPTDLVTTNIYSHLTSQESVRASLIHPDLLNTYRRSPTVDIEYQGQMQHHDNVVNFIDGIIQDRDPDAPLRKLCLRLAVDAEDEDNVNGWIQNALQYPSLVDLELLIDAHPGYELPPQLFQHAQLVKMKLVSADGQIVPAVNPVNLLSLQSLELAGVSFGPQEFAARFAALIVGSPVLEELKIVDLDWFGWPECRITSPSLRRITFGFTEDNERNGRPISVSFNTPNLVFLDYEDDVATSYLPLSQFPSLGEARIKLLNDDFEDDEGNAEEDLNFANQVSEFLSTMTTVRRLSLSATTLQLMDGAEIPQFNQLEKLAIESREDTSWAAVVTMLNRAPQLSCLSFHGLFHEQSLICGNICRCEPENVPNDLANSPVTHLNIFEKGQALENEDAFWNQMVHFLRNMPNLQHVTITGTNASNRVVQKLGNYLRYLPNKASPGCAIMIFPPRQD